MEGTLESGTISISPGEIGSDKIGFTDDKFRGTVVLKGNRAYIFYINSLHEGEGNAQRFIRGLADMGYEVRVVRPNATMRHICSKIGLKKQMESVREFYCGEVIEVWGMENSL